MIVAVTTLSPQPPGLAQQIGDPHVAIRWVAAFGSGSAHAAGDIQPRQLPYRQRARHNPETPEYAVDLMWRRPLLQEKFALPAIRRVDPVADEAKRVGRNDRN